jgi:hypothetical protein
MVQSSGAGMARTRPVRVALGRSMSYARMSLYGCEGYKIVQGIEEARMCSTTGGEREGGVSGRRRGGDL